MSAPRTRNARPSATISDTRPPWERYAAQPTGAAAARPPWEKYASPAAAEKPSNTPASILGAAYLGGAQPVGAARREFEAGGQAGALAVPAVGAAALALPAAIAAPGATAANIGLGYLGSEAGERVARRGAKMLGASPQTTDTAGRVGSWVGAIGGPFGIAAAIERASLRGLAADALARMAAPRPPLAAAGARVAAPVAESAAPVVATEAAVPAAASAAAGGASVPASRALLDFAAQSGAKAGAKVHLLLDKTGAPVRVLTPAQAAAATRAGQPTTWVRNVADPVAAATRRRAAESALQGLGVIDPTP